MQSAQNAVMHLKFQDAGHRPYTKNIDQQPFSVDHWLETLAQLVACYHISYSLVSWYVQDGDKITHLSLPDTSRLGVSLEYGNVQASPTEVL